MAASFSSLWSIRLWIVLGNLSTIALFLAIGMVIDARLGSRPTGLIVALILSFPVSQLVTIKLLKPFLNRP